MKIVRTQLALILSIVGSLTLLSACQTFSVTPKAVAIIQSKGGSGINGSLSFEQDGKYLLVSGNFTGLKPNALQGVHVHENGDCSAMDVSSAGGHYNPDNVRHGNAMSVSHHAGDMPNIQSDSNGNATYVAKLSNLTLEGERSIMGRSVVVHRDADDYKSQPAGNSGARIGCGIIR